MKKLLCVFALLAFVFATSSARADIIQADSKITSVVVYPDRALVTRTAAMELSKGDHEVVFGSLPPNINIDSLRAKGKGTASVRILSLESQKVILDRPHQERVAELKDKIQGIGDKIAEVKTRKTSLTAELKLVRAIGVYSGEQFSKEFITRQPGIDEWNAMLEFQRENMGRINEEIDQVKIQTRELERELDKLNRQLAEIRGHKERAGREVTVSISALSPGKFNLSVSSVMRGASWHPVYDARADLKTGKVEIAYIGNVRQNTGEDWTDVDIALSTARPAIGAKMPELGPWVIRPRPITRFAGPRESAEDALYMRGIESKAKREPAPPAAPPMKEAEQMVATLVQHETSIQFAIPRKMDVPADNAFHRMTILAKKLPAPFSYNATPRLSPFAYLSAKIKNTTDAQWLPGKVSVFVDGDFIGTSQIEPVAKNEEMTLDLGIDEGIKIEREILTRLADETFILGKKKRSFKDKITVENHKSREVELTVIDHIPVAGHKDIKITDVKFSKKPSEKDDDKGITKWKLKLTPAAKKEITIEFIVTHPKDMVVGGL
jgi:uncharacterized protein (TIGR02231 family)